MKVEVKTLDNNVSGDIQLPESVFDVSVRPDIIARVIHWQLAKRRSGNHQVKRIADVQGTSKKPFRQKGTGNARQGSLRSPQMRGGATMHGPVTRDHSYKLPKKVRSFGLKSALASKIQDNKILILEDLKVDKADTSNMRKKISGLGLTSALFVEEMSVSRDFSKSISNLVKVNAVPVCGINVYDVMNHDTLVLTRGAVKKLEERFS